MKLLIGKKQFEKIEEQSMTGWGANLPSGTASEVVKGWSDPNNLKKVFNVELESKLREFLYSPEGIAATIGLNMMSGEPLVIGLFSILVAYDIKKWIDEGEPNWLYLISDLICVSTAGFASSSMVMVRAAKNVKFKNLFSFFSWVKQKVPQIWTKYIVPFAEGCQKLISKVISILNMLAKNSNFGKFFSIPEIITRTLGGIISYLKTLITIIEETMIEIFGKVATKTGLGYGKYKTTAELAKKAAETETGQEVIKKTLPYVNHLLGSDKIDPFLVDLMASPSGVDLSKYKIHPIFLDNSKDSF